MQLQVLLLLMMRGLALLLLISRVVQQVWQRRCCRRNPPAKCQSAQPQLDMPGPSLGCFAVTCLQYLTLKLRHMCCCLWCCWSKVQEEAVPVPAAVPVMLPSHELR